MVERSCGESNLNLTWKAELSVDRPFAPGLTRNSSRLKMHAFTGTQRLGRSIKFDKTLNSISFAIGKKLKKNSKM
jgi:hypothetical protein